MSLSSAALVVALSTSCFSVPVSAAFIERSDCRAADNLLAPQHNSEQCIIIAPSNVLLRCVVPALRLDYDAQHRLRDHLGLTNISADDSNRTVYVQYHHSPN